MTLYYTQNRKNRRESRGWGSSSEWRKTTGSGQEVEASSNSKRRQWPGANRKEVVSTWSRSYSNITPLQTRWKYEADMDEKHIYCHPKSSTTHRQDGGVVFTMVCSSGMLESVHWCVVVLSVLAHVLYCLITVLDFFRMCWRFLEDTFLLLRPWPLCCRR